MDFAWSTAELERQRAAHSLGSELGGDIVARDREGRLLPSDWSRLAEEGLLGALLPTSMGGGGRSLMELVAELEGLGETCHDAGLLFMLSAQSFAFVAPVLEHGSLSQQERRLRDLAQGRLRGALP